MAYKCELHMVVNCSILLSGKNSVFWLRHYLKHKARSTKKNGQLGMEISTLLPSWSSLIIARLHMQINSSSTFQTTRRRKRTQLILHCLILFIVCDRTDHFIYINMTSLMFLSPGLFFCAWRGYQLQVSFSGQTPGDQHAHILVVFES